MSAWTGVRVLRHRVGATGEFVIRKAPGGVRLTFADRKHGIKLHSDHADVKAAQRHAAEMITSLDATSMSSFDRLTDARGIR